MAILTSNDEQLAHKIYEKYHDMLLSDIDKKFGLSTIDADSLKWHIRRSTVTFGYDFLLTFKDSFGEHHGILFYVDDMELLP